MSVISPTEGSRVVLRVLWVKLLYFIDDMCYHKSPAEISAPCMEVLTIACKIAWIKP